MQYLADQFWLRWKRDYLVALTFRKKWYRRGIDLQPGDLVLLRGPAARSSWPTGLIAELICGDDGVARSAFVNVVAPGGKTIKIRRSVHQLVLLIPRDRDDEENPAR